MGDSDGSYDFYHLDKFLEKLDEGYDLVVGNRFIGGIEKGAMSLSHKNWSTNIIKIFKFDISYTNKRLSLWFKSI